MESRIKNKIKLKNVLDHYALKTKMKKKHLLLNKYFYFF
jgi:hypothetical protein